MARACDSRDLGKRTIGRGQVLVIAAAVWFLLTQAPIGIAEEPAVVWEANPKVAEESEPPVVEETPTPLSSSDSLASPEDAGGESSDTPNPSPEDGGGETRDTPNLAREDGGAETDAGPVDELLRFNFRYQPWKDVLDWFAEQSDLSLVMDAPPPGTFNYTDSRGYTPTEALDRLNGVLLTKGYTLVRRGRMLLVVDLEKGIPPNLVANVPLDDLDNRGEHELIKVVFPLDKLSAEEANAEVEPLLGPQGSIIQLPKSRRIQVTETAGRLRVIWSVLTAIENPADSRGEMREIVLVHRSAIEILPVLRQMLGIAEEANLLPDGSLRIAVDSGGRRLIVQGDPDKLRQLEKVLELIDVPGASGSDGLAEAPRLEVYTVTGADPSSVLEVLQTLLAGDPDARLATDPQTGNLVALVGPSQHATIRATIVQMQRDARQIDVIPLSSVDPQMAVLAIDKLFNAGGEKPDPTAPRVDADLTTRSLMVRASPSQLEQIRILLEKLGESLDDEGVRRSRGNVRLLPLDSRAANSALYQIEQIWPTMRPNRIRVVTPSSSRIPAFRPGQRWNGRGSDSDEDSGSRGQPDIRSLLPFLDELPSRRPPKQSPRPTDPPHDDRAADPSTAISPRVPFFFAGQSGAGSRRTPQADDLSSQQPATQSTTSRRLGGEETTSRRLGGEETTSRRPGNNAVRPPAPILVAPGPGGVLIASEDLDALDDFELLLTDVAGRSNRGGREFAVYYLRYAKAKVIAETVTEIFGGGGGEGGGGGLLGDIAGAALGGGATGDLVGSLLGIGGSGGASALALGSIDVVPDSRLNALIVRAKPKDLDTLEQLLQILDQPEAPEQVQIDAPPRLIPVYNTSAEYIAGIITQVYQDRMRSGGGGRNEPSPEELIRALRGGGKGRGSTEKEQEEATKMSVGIDTHSNSLVVRAPDALFQEVRLLVEKLDTVDSNIRHATKIVTLSAVSPAAVQDALSALFGESVQVTQSAPGTAAAANNGRNGAAGSSRGQSNDMQRRIEFFQRMRQMQNRSGGDGRSGDGRGGQSGRGRGRGGPGGGRGARPAGG